MKTSIPTGLKRLIFAAFVVAALPIVSSASTVINFAGFTDLEVLTTQDFGDGVTFAGTEILSCCDTDGSGSLNNAFFPPPADDGGSTDGVNVAYNPSGPLTLTFINPSSFFQAAFTYNDGLTVTAYNAAMMVIATANGACGASGSGANYVGSGCGAPNEVINITTPGISEIVITGGSGDNFTIDDVSFTGSVNVGVATTPEPGTITMVLGGLGCLVAFRRRRLTQTQRSK
jgi:uncharacterized protein (TIGR03382 family)